MGLNHAHKQSEMTTTSSKRQDTCFLSNTDSGSGNLQNTAHIHSDLCVAVTVNLYLLYHITSITSIFQWSNFGRVVAGTVQVLRYTQVHGLEIMKCAYHYFLFIHTKIECSISSDRP